MISDCKTFAHKGCKIATQKKKCFSANFALLAGFFGIGATIRIGREILCLPYAGFFQKFPFGTFSMPEKLTFDFSREVFQIRGNPFFVKSRNF